MMAKSPPFPRKFHSPSRLLLKTALLLPATALADATPMASPWQATGGQQVEVTSGYTSSSGDIPLVVSDPGSLLVVKTPGLEFSTTQDDTPVAQIGNQGGLRLNEANLSTAGYRAHAIELHPKSWTPSQRVGV